jgi:hypothetical protein
MVLPLPWPVIEVSRAARNAKDSLAGPSGGKGMRLLCHRRMPEDRERGQLAELCGGADTSETRSHNHAAEIPTVSPATSPSRR